MSSISTKEQRDGDQENAAAEAHSLLKWVHAHPYFISISTPDSSFYCARTHTQRAAGENESERAERDEESTRAMDWKESTRFLRAIFTCQGGYIILVWKAGTPFSAQQWPGCRLRCRQRAYCWKLEPRARSPSLPHTRFCINTPSSEIDWLLHFLRPVVRELHN